MAWWGGMSWEGCNGLVGCYGPGGCNGLVGWYGPGRPLYNFQGELNHHVQLLVILLSRILYHISVFSCCSCCCYCCRCRCCRYVLATVIIMAMVLTCPLCCCCGLVIYIFTTKGK